MNAQTMYTCGRIHKSCKQKLGAPNAQTKAVVDAVYKMMQAELSTTACERWCSRLNAELGLRSFGPGADGVPETRAAKVPRVWVPAKPKLALALLDELHRTCEECAEGARQVSIGSQSAISKVLARHAVERLRETKGAEWLRACNELADDQIGDAVKLNQTLSRVAFDLLVYVHARALELRREDEGHAVLELHSSDQTLVGKAMRGCGVVYCESGRVIFSRAITLVRGALLSPP